MVPLKVIDFKNVLIGGGPNTDRYDQCRTGQRHFLIFYRLIFEQECKAGSLALLNEIQRNDSGKKPSR